MTVESIDKLREYGHDCCARVDDAIHGYADEIEAEISERYVLLPLDADGVPCKVGDMVEFKGREYEVFGVSEDGVYVNNGDIWMVLFPRGDMHHVKPRAIEDVLREFVNHVVTFKGSREGIPVVGIDDDLWRDYYAECADELRDLMGVKE